MSDVVWCGMLWCGCSTIMLIVYLSINESCYNFYFDQKVEARGA
jgi:hypothetical protein